MNTVVQVLAIYEGSDADATRALYAALEARGPIGKVAVNLFRAHKASSRAKVYRGGGFRREAYGKKEWSLAELCDALEQHAATAGIVAWGWREDPAQDVHRHVLYVDLPTGQVSFHTGGRRQGPDYPGHWDGSGLSALRIVRYCARVLDGATTAVRPYLCDHARHLVCRPFTLTGLHTMAQRLGIGRHWFHDGRWPHYDVPLRRHAEILARPDVEVVSPRELLRRLKADRILRQAPAAPPQQMGLL